MDIGDAGSAVSAPRIEPRVELQPISFKQAAAFVNAHHRHHVAPRGHKFVIGVAAEGQVVGVAIAGRPVARALDDGWTIEVTRVCTLGHKNAASMLYGASARVARALGFRRIITYTLASEPGTSLRASGWERIGETRSDNVWNRPNTGRHRGDEQPLGTKVRWEKRLS